ncbi:sialic acid-binding Ig-like lectin 12 [Xenopus tropicalis]|uniref:Sialic acid-binding Ig-like lectin 12 n=1 Tax=Xenopus tropicalis TaxID=8364 RepID=A0A8J1JX00_XENTR|nr:sialic acid-binding Ig-like lectin 12 [Xenopus tropicalis]
MTCDIVAASTNDCIIHTQTKGRFTLTGKVQEGDCSFSISNAQPADRGVYEFRIEDGNHKYSYIWNHLFVSVTDLPEPTISPIGELIAGKPITLTCTAHPAPQGCKGIITWGGRINIENMSNYEREDQAGKVTSISDITVTPSQREHNSPLTCTVTYSGVSTNSSITLGVQSLANDTIKITELMFCGIFVLLLAAIVIVLMMKYKKKRRPPEQTEESKSSSPNCHEVVYSHIERRSDVRICYCSYCLFACYYLP